MPRRILGRVLPKEQKVGSIFLPEDRLVGAGTGTYEPIKIRVEQVGSEVDGIQAGDVLVLAPHALDYIDSERVIIPWTLHGDFYHPITLRRYRSKEEIRRAKDDEVMQGIIHYVETPEAIAEAA